MNRAKDLIGVREFYTVLVEWNIEHINMKMIKFLCLLLTTIVFIGCQKPKSTIEKNDQELASYFDNLTFNKDFSGVVLIGNKEKVLSFYSGGLSDFELDKEHSIQSKFSIASNTKAFTAGAILKLKSEGKIQLSDKVGKYLPSFTYGDSITILHCLRHESGLSNIDHEKLGSTILSTDKLLSEIGKNPLLFEPGTNGSYSNAGFNVLAAVVEKVSGQKFGDYLDQHFFQPLGMNSSGEFNFGDAPMNLSKSYFPDAPPNLLRELPTFNYSQSLGSGSMYSTAEDLWKWGVAVSERKFNFDFFEEDYPYGWGRDTIAGAFSLNQTGLNNGYVSSLFIFPDKDIVIVLLSNIENELWSSWSKDIAKIHFKDSSNVFHPSKRHLFEDAANQEKFSEFEGTYVRDANRFIVIKKSANGHLYLHLDGNKHGHYLMPVGENTFDLRSFSGTISFKGNDSLNWAAPQRWGGGVESYSKEE